MKTTRGERLRAARINAGFKSGAEAARSLGIPQPTYNSHERAGLPGGRDYSPEEAAKYGRRFRVDDAWLLTGKGEGPKKPPPFTHDSFQHLAGGHIDSGDVLRDPVPVRRMVRLVGYVGAGSEAHFYALADDDYEFVEAPDGASDQTVAAEIRGKSLGPLFDRWLVYYDDIRSPVTPDLYGELCVVGLADDRVLVKQIIAHSDGSYSLISNNSNEPPIRDAEIEWAARVTDMKRRRR